MPEENQIQNEQKNTVATVGMRFSIIGLIILILNVIGIAATFNETSMYLGLMMFITTLVLGIGIPLFFIGFILGIIGLFYKPKTKARIAILISVVSTVFINTSISAPANEFVNWAQNWVEQTNRESLDEDLVDDIFETESNKIVNNKTKQDWISMYNSYNSINPIKKVSYLFFSVIKECMDASLEKITNGEMPEITDSDNQLITIDIENEDNSENSNEETSNVEVESESVEVFTQSEKNDIEQIINILE